MKKTIFLLIIVSIFKIVLTEDYLTIYNNNQGLFKTQVELNLERGIQYYSLENIPTGIITESVTFIPKDKNLHLFNQNFEYDLASSDKMLRKYIDKNVKVFTEQETFQGTLIFFDNQNFGLKNEQTNELQIIKSAKVNNIFLSEMPSDFYTRPTLRWQLSANNKAKYTADLSYLTAGIEWKATYNAVINKNDLTLNSWVTINNRSGKIYDQVNLKLIAGDVQTHQNLMSMNNIRGGRANEIQYGVVRDAPTFVEREFSDFRIYTLDQKVDIDNNQEKQLSLYPLKNVKYVKKYEYQIGSSIVDVFITFKNSTANGLGVPLPRGNINFYEIDDKDGTQQFVGVATLENTSLNQDVSLRTGAAFDIVGKTTTISSSSTGRSNEAEYEVSITNNKSEAIEIEAIKKLNHVNSEVLTPSIPFERKDANTVIFKIKLNPGQERKITFKERATW